MARGERGQIWDDPRREFDYWDWQNEMAMREVSRFRIIFYVFSNLTTRSIERESGLRFISNYYLSSYLMQTSNIMNIRRMDRVRTSTRMDKVGTHKKVKRKGELWR